MSNSAVTPDVAVGPDGLATLAWVSGGIVQNQVIIGEERAGDFAMTSATARVPGHAVDPRVAVGPKGEAIVTWQTTADGVTAVYRSLRTPIGEWIHPSGVADAVSFPPSAYEVEALIGVDGELLQVWNQWSGSTWGVAIANRPAGVAAFNGPRDSRDVVSPPVLFTNYPEVTRNSRGDALVTWYQSVGGELRAFVSERYGVAGSFSRSKAVAVLSTPESPVENPSPAVADTGEAVVVWRQEVAGGKMALFMASRGSDRAWHKPTDLSEAFSRPSDFVWNNRVRFTARGDLYVVWQQTDRGDRGVYAAHRRADGTWASDGASPLRLSAPGAVAFDPWLASGDDEEVVVVWTEHRGGEFSVVARYSASDASGAQEPDRWSAPTVLSLAGKGNAGTPRVAIGGGRVVAAWTQAGRVWTASVD